MPYILDGDTIRLEVSPEVSSLDFAAGVVIQGTAVPGFAFLASIIIIFSGTQLFSLGMIGEYLSRMHFRLLDRPSYVVRDHADA